MKLELVLEKAKITGYHQFEIPLLPLLPLFRIKNLILWAD